MVRFGERDTSDERRTQVRLRARDPVVCRWLSGQQAECWRAPDRAPRVISLPTTRGPYPKPSRASRRIHSRGAVRVPNAARRRNRQVTARTDKDVPRARIVSRARGTRNEAASAARNRSRNAIAAGAILLYLARVEAVAAWRSPAGYRHALAVYDEPGEERPESCTARFDERVADRDRRVAVPASPSNAQPRQHGNELGCAERCAADRAV
jgi:hypothetical protein